MPLSLLLSPVAVHIRIRIIVFYSASLQISLFFVNFAILLGIAFQSYTEKHVFYVILQYAHKVSGHYSNSQIPSLTGPGVGISKFPSTTN